MTMWEALQKRRVSGLDLGWMFRETQRIVPPLMKAADTISYSITHRGEDLIVADEQGYIHVLDEPKVSGAPRQIHQTARKSHFRCAPVSIFDVEVSRWNSTVFCSGSDGTLYHADLEKETVIRSCQLHSMSIKCAREHPIMEGQIVTTSRDGSIAFIDVRERGLQPLWTVSGAHLAFTANSKRKRGRYNNPMGSNGKTVSACAWLSDCMIATSGVVDGKLKVWDTRKCPSSGRQEPVSETVVQELDRRHSQTVVAGISWLDTKAGYLLAACPRAGTTVVYRCADFICGRANEAEPVDIFPSLVHDSFYFRPKFSHHAEFVAIGSPDNNVSIWKVGARRSSEFERPTKTILGMHDGEVTMVSWGNNFHNLASTGDDGNIYSWSVVR